MERTIAYWGVNTRCFPSSLQWNVIALLSYFACPKKAGAKIHKSNHPAGLLFERGRWRMRSIQMQMLPFSWNMSMNIRFSWYRLFRSLLKKEKSQGKLETQPKEKDEYISVQFWHIQRPSYWWLWHCGDDHYRHRCVKTQTKSARSRWHHSTTFIHRQEIKKDFSLQKPPC